MKNWLWRYSKLARFTLLVINKFPVRTHKFPVNLQRKFDPLCRNHMISLGKGQGTGLPMLPLLRKFPAKYPVTGKLEC
jgi:hypothetical protein